MASANCLFLSIGRIFLVVGMLSNFILYPKYFDILCCESLSPIKIPWRMFLFLYFFVSAGSQTDYVQTTSSFSPIMDGWFNISLVFKAFAMLYGSTQVYTTQSLIWVLFSLYIIVQFSKSLPCFFGLFHMYTIQRWAWGSYWFLHRTVVAASLALFSLESYPPTHPPNLMGLFPLTRNIVSLSFGIHLTQFHVMVLP